MGRAAKRKRDPEHRAEMARRRLAREEAAQAALDEIDAKIARDISELRKAEHVLDPPREGRGQA